MIVIDTSVLIDSFTGPRRLQGALRSLSAKGERVAIPSLVIYEWLRGPRTNEEVAYQEAAFPASSAIPFVHEDASLSAILYRAVPRARTREIDIAIAACAIRRNAELWTLNTGDFADIPGLRLWRSPATRLQTLNFD